MLSNPNSLTLPSTKYVDHPPLGQVVANRRAKAAEGDALVDLGCKGARLQPSKGASSMHLFPYHRTKYDHLPRPPTPNPTYTWVHGGVQTLLPPRPTLSIYQSSVLPKTKTED